MVSLASIGFLTLLRYPLSLVQVLLTFTPFSRPFTLALTPLSKNKLNQQGPSAWAIVTGPTGGIGKEFAIQLARSGFSLFLIGRNPTKLKALESELSHSLTPSSQIRLHAIDLESASETDWTELDSALAEVAQLAPLSVLVNNAGLSHASPISFESTPLNELNSITAVNVIAPIRLTKIVVPFMLRHRAGLILNLGSFSALVPTPMLATYAGTKGFLYTWSQALGAELEPKGIHVRLLNTYFVVRLPSPSSYPLQPSAPPPPFPFLFLLTDCFVTFSFF